MKIILFLVGGSSDDTISMEAAYVNISLAIPLLNEEQSINPCELLDELSSFERALRDNWSSVVTMQFVVKSILSSRQGLWSDVCASAVTLVLATQLTTAYSF